MPLKKLDKFILKSYLGPFILTFFIAMFVLLMQFLWKYLEDLVGKGLEFSIIAELLFYASASIVPMALPLAILLSSIMTFGNLGEQYELAALKAAGISLNRVMRPLIILSIAISALAFLFSNYMLPYAKLKMGTLIYDIMNQKPSFNIQEGVYYKGIEGYVLRVGKKDKDGQTMYNMFIYDHTKNRGNNKVIIAKKGRMEVTKDERFLLFTLYNGNVYDEIETTRPNSQNRPFIRTSFDEERIKFDISSFKMQRTEEEMFKDNYQMLNITQLDASTDSIFVNINKRLEDCGFQLKNSMGLNPDSIKGGLYFDASFIGNPLDKMNKADKLRTLDIAANLIRGSKNYVDASVQEKLALRHMIIRNQMEWHRKFTLSIACLVLFFIGAPLGAIVRKGGLGMPMVLSILFFLGFHILSITGEKIASEEVWTPLSGMWMSTFILLPIGAFLTFKSTSDSKLFELDFYLRLLKIRKSLRTA